MQISACSEGAQVLGSTARLLSLGCFGALFSQGATAMQFDCPIALHQFRWKAVLIRSYGSEVVKLLQVPCFMGYYTLSFYVGYHTPLAIESYVFPQPTNQLDICYPFVDKLVCTKRTNSHTFSSSLNRICCDKSRAPRWSPRSLPRCEWRGTINYIIARHDNIRQASIHEKWGPLIHSSGKIPAFRPVQS